MARPRREAARGQETCGSIELPARGMFASTRSRFTVSRFLTNHPRPIPQTTPPKHRPALTQSLINHIWFLEAPSETFRNGRRDSRLQTDEIRQENYHRTSRKRRRRKVLSIHPACSISPSIIAYRTSRYPRYRLDWPIYSSNARFDGREVHQSTEGWVPVYADGEERRLACMSVGFLLKKKGDSVVWRGPKKNAMIRQFLSDVRWGELDYLVVDTPPGKYTLVPSITLA